VTAVAGAVVATGTIDLTWPMAAMAVAYIVGQTVVDTWGKLRDEDRHREAE
tara:strand:- start:609 stop:761 length:153 start_codon:yes stop_codon:yes gene_type:complete